LESGSLQLRETSEEDDTRTVRDDKISLMITADSPSQPQASIVNNQEKQVTTSTGRSLQ